MSILRPIEYHKDTTIRRALNENDRIFLKELQTELNTQDHLCTTDPRYWCLVQTKQYPTSDDYADDYILYDTDCCDILANNTNEIRKYIINNYNESFNNYCNTNNITADNTTLYHLSEFIKNSDNNLKIIPVQNVEEIIHNTMFLTHKDAVNYLKKYGYNHSATTHPYCMNAYRSNSYDKLLELLQKVNWDGVTLEQPIQNPIVCDTPPADDAKIVYICAPFRGNTMTEQAANIENAKKYCRYAISKGYAPFSAHLAVCSFLNEQAPYERDVGIQMDLIMLRACNEIWVFGKRITDGMNKEIAHATKMGLPIRYFDEVNNAIHEINNG